MVTDCSGCGQVFMGEGARCPACESKRDPLECAECGTRMLVAVPDGRCGICNEDFDAAAFPELWTVLA